MRRARILDGCLSLSGGCLCRGGGARPATAFVGDGRITRLRPMRTSRAGWTGWPGCAD